MKKNKILPVLLLSCLTFGLITSCGPTNPTSSIENITGVEIGGPNSVNVGKTIKLVADVVGSDNESVTWESSDTNIATIDVNGNVLGVAEGEVIITAKSTAKPEYFATKTISVTAEIATGLNVIIEENESTTKVNDGIYNVNLGSVIDINLALTPNNSKALDSVAIEVTSPSDIPTSQFVVTHNENDIMHSTFVGYTPAQGVVVKFTGTYIGNANAPLVTSVIINVIDSQEQERAEISNLISTNLLVEQESLKSATITSTYKDEYTNYLKNYEVKSFKDVTYTHIEEKQGDEVTNKTSYFSGLYSTKKKTTTNYYCFEYNPSNGEVTNFYANETAKDNEYRQHLFVENSTSGLTHGISNKLLKLLENAANPYDNMITFYDTYAYVNTKYYINDNNYVVEANFDYPDSTYRYELHLEIDVNKNNLITSYSFKENVYNENVLTAEYEEICSSMSYGTKESHNPNESGNIDLETYFLQSFIVENCNEVTEYYDYSNTDKYGAQQVDIIDGITKYTVLKDKTLILKVVNNGSNTHASLSIDRVEGESSNPSIIKHPVLSGNDIFAINPYKDPATNVITLGEATLTFTSSLGITQKVIVEFVESELLSVFTTYVPENNDFGDIFKGRYSDYFFINTNPDEDKYEYYLDIIEGSKNGIEIIRHEYNNIWGYPGFSYAILGKEIGTYKFRIGVEGSFLTTQDYYTVNVVAPYSVEYLEEQLVTKQPTFIYYTGTLQTDLTFVSNTQINLTTKILGENPTSSTINYHFEEGKIVLASSQKLNEGMYFGDVKEGEIYFNKDLTSVILLMSMEDDLGATKTYTHFEFKQKVTDVESYVKGKSFQKEIFISGTGTATAVMSFTNDGGKFIIKDAENNELINATFKYSYNAPATAFYLTDIEYNYKSKENYSIDDEIYFNELYGTLEIKFYTNSYSYNKITFTL